MELEINKLYSETELRNNFFNVSGTTWKNDKERYLEHFALFFEYEIQEVDKSRIYRIIDIKSPYEPIPRKSKKCGTAKEIYQEEIVKEISKNKLQTGKSISEAIKDKKSIVELKHTDNYRYEKTRTELKEMFGSKPLQGGSRGIISERIWARKVNGKYEALTQEEQEGYRAIIREAYGMAGENIQAAKDDYANGLISKKELNEIVKDINQDAYSQCIDEFKEKYGFRPTTANIYEINAF